jgi:hypothetical protein
MIECWCIIPGWTTDGIIFNIAEWKLFNRKQVSVRIAVKDCKLIKRCSFVDCYQRMDFLYVHEVGKERRLRNPTAFKDYLDDLIESWVLLHMAKEILVNEVTGCLYTLQELMVCCDTKVHFVREIERLLMNHFEIPEKKSGENAISKCHKLETYRLMAQKCGDQRYRGIVSSKEEISTGDVNHELLVQLLSVHKHSRSTAKSAGRKKGMFLEAVKILNERSFMACLSKQRRREDMIEWKRRFQLATEAWESEVLANDEEQCDVNV